MKSTLSNKNFRKNIKNTRKPKGSLIRVSAASEELRLLTSPAKTEFLASDTKYSVSSGYIYPIFGAFRSLLKFDEQSETASWLFHPIEIWNEVGTSIVQNTFETYSNPQLAGKDKQLWLSNYRIVETQSLRKLLGRR